jgi:hypothetical protein
VHVSTGPALHGLGKRNWEVLCRLVTASSRIQRRPVDGAAGNIELLPINLQAECIQL